MDKLYKIYQNKIKNKFQNNGYVKTVNKNNKQNNVKKRIKVNKSIKKIIIIQKGIIMDKLLL